MTEGNPYGLKMPLFTMKCCQGVYHWLEHGRITKKEQKIRKIKERHSPDLWEVWEHYVNGRPVLLWKPEISLIRESGAEPYKKFVCNYYDEIDRIKWSVRASEDREVSRAMYDGIGYNGDIERLGSEAAIQAKRMKLRPSMGEVREFFQDLIDNGDEEKSPLVKLLRDVAI